MDDWYTECGLRPHCITVHKKARETNGKVDIRYLAFNIKDRILLPNTILVQSNTSNNFSWWKHYEYKKGQINVVQL